MSPTLSLGLDIIQTLLSKKTNITLYSPSQIDFAMFQNMKFKANKYVVAYVNSMAILVGQMGNARGCGKIVRKKT